MSWGMMTIVHLSTFQRTRRGCHPIYFAIKTTDHLEDEGMTIVMTSRSKRIKRPPLQSKVTFIRHFSLGRTTLKTFMMAMFKSGKESATKHE